MRTCLLLSYVLITAVAIGGEPNMDLMTLRAQRDAAKAKKDAARGQDRIKFCREVVRLHTLIRQAEFAAEAAGHNKKLCEDHAGELIRYYADGYPLEILEAQVPSKDELAKLSDAELKKWAERVRYYERHLKSEVKQDAGK